MFHSYYTKCFADTIQFSFQIVVGKLCTGVGLAVQLCTAITHFFHYCSGINGLGLANCI